MTSPPADVDVTDLVKVHLRLSGITVEPGAIELISATLAVVLEHAARVESAALGDEAEPAPVFEA